MCWEIDTVHGSHIDWWFSLLITKSQCRKMPRHWVFTKKKKLIVQSTQWFVNKIIFFGNSSRKPSWKDFVQARQFIQSIWLQTNFACTCSNTSIFRGFPQFFSGLRSRARIWVIPGSKRGPYTNQDPILLITFWTTVIVGVNNDYFSGLAFPLRSPVVRALDFVPGLRNDGGWSSVVKMVYYTMM